LFIRIEKIRLKNKIDQNIKKLIKKITLLHKGGVKKEKTMIQRKIQKIYCNFFGIQFKTSSNNGISQNNRLNFLNGSQKIKEEHHQ
jgi:uncharacterized protein Veg